MAIRILSSENITGNITLHSPTNAPYIDFVENADTSDSKARITMDQIDTNNGQLIFSTEKAGTLTTALTISQSQNATFAGRVGIGKTPSQWILDVDSADAYIGSFDGSGNTGVVLNSNNSTAAQIIGYSNSASAYNDLDIRSNSTAGSGVYIDGSTSRVGIGTTVPDGKVHIFKGSNGATTVGTASDELILENDTDCGLTIRSAADATGVVSFASPTDHNIGQLYYNHDDDSMVIKTNDAIRTIIGSSGIMYIMGATASTNNSLQLQYNSTAGTAEIYSKSTGGNTTFEFYTSSSGTTTQKFNIGSSGDVKITTNGKFLQGIRNTSGSVIDMIGFGAGTDRLQIKGGTSGGAESIAFFDTAGQMATFYNSNFGIGVTSPSGKLEVAGGNTLGFRLSNLGNQSAYDQVRMTYSGYNSGSPTVTFMPLTTPGGGNVDTTYHFSNSNGLNANNNRANVNIDGILYVGSGRQSGETTLIMRNYDDTLVDSNEIQNSIRMSGRYWSGSASQLVETRINSVHQESNGNGGSALTFWTQTGGSAATEQMRIDKVGNVGIKTTPSAVLHIYNQYDVTADTDKCGIRMTRVSGGSQSWLWSLGQSGVSNNYFGLRDITHGVYKMMFKEGTGTQVMFGNPSNNGSFGASNTILSIKGSTSGGEGILQITGLGNNATDNVGRIDFHSYNESDAMASIRSVRGNADDVGQLEFWTNSGGGVPTERMRITSGGELYVGHSSTNPDHGLTVVDPGNGTYIQLDHINGTVSGSIFSLFRYNQSVIGSITQNGTSQVSFNISSDYRLKEDLKDFAGLDMVSKIPVYDFKWKTDESRSYGVMAHELQEVLPDAVVGKKDAEEMQGVDYSKIVPLLIKAIQELKAEIELLKNK